MSWAIIGVYPSTTGLKVIARSGNRVIHRDRLTPEQVGMLDFEAEWRGASPKPISTTIGNMLAPK